MNHALPAPQWGIAERSELSVRQAIRATTYAIACGEGLLRFDGDLHRKAKNVFASKSPESPACARMRKACFSGKTKASRNATSWTKVAFSGARRCTLRRPNLRLYKSSQQCDRINYQSHIYGNRSAKLPYCSIPLPFRCRPPEIPLPTSCLDINQPIDLNDNSVVTGALFASEKPFPLLAGSRLMTICAGVSRFSANLVVDEIGDQAERPLGVRRGQIPGDERVRLAFETVKRDRAA